MTKPETQSAATNTDPKAVAVKETSPEEVAAKSAFLEKVSDIPFVNAAKECYNQVKQMNKMANFTLTTAESTVLYLATTAKPFLEKVQPQAKMVDDMACRGLEVVEANAPFIMKTPEEMVGEARKLYAASLESGMQKVDEIKTMGTGALSSVKNYGLQKASECLAGSEELVDKYLPPAFGEAARADHPEGQSFSERATRLSTTVSQRVYNRGVKQFIQVQNMSQESITKLNYLLDLLQHIEENYSGKSVRDIMDGAKVKANWVWEELKKEPTEATDPDKRLEQRMLAVARRITSGLVATYTMAYTGLPQACLDGGNAAAKYAIELFGQFDQALNAGEAGTTFLEKAQKTVAALETVVLNMLRNLQATQKEADLGTEMENLAVNDDAPAPEEQKS